MIPSILTPLANHLWQSTLFVAAIWLIILALRKNRAAVRHRLWLVASVKFLVPFTVLASCGSYFQWPVDTVPTPPRAVAAVAHSISEPFAVPEPSVVPPALAIAPTPAPGRIPAVLLLVWLCGFATSIVWWAVRWSQLRRMLRRATPLNLDAPLPVMGSPERIEPGVFGIFRPILLLPEDIVDRLSPEALQAVLAHEFCHVRRRDNLTAAIHMFVEAVFWFHPLVWWVKARLIEEQERACDEAVLGLGGNPQIYAESILKICEFYLAGPLICMSGIAGSDLKKESRKSCEIVWQPN
jgi:beta-lactamase regulating signal transducer with metallopeptidase domain